MSTPTCPYCNAAEDPNWRGENVAWFRCGTMIAPDKPSREDQTNQCVEDEVGRLSDQRDQLLQKVQRLEEEAADYMTLYADWKAYATNMESAGDYMLKAGFHSPVAQSAWTKAKETKP